MDRQLHQTLAEIRARLEPSFSPELAKGGLSGRTPSAGHCAAVSLIIRDLLGGELVSSVVNGESHWFNRLSTSDGPIDVDITADQFGLDPVRVAEAGKLYSSTRLRFDSEIAPETLRRSELLRDRAGLGKRG